MGQSVGEDDLYFSYVNNHPDVWIDANGSVAADFGSNTDGWGVLGNEYLQWHPTYKIEQAWLVRRKLIASGFTVNIKNNVVTGYRDNQYHIVYTKDGNVPRAICELALDAMS
jgi:hypothetical protein